MQRWLYSFLKVLFILRQVMLWKPLPFHLKEESLESFHGFLKPVSSLHLMMCRMSANDFISKQIIKCIEMYFKLIGVILYLRSDWSNSLKTYKTRDIKRMTQLYLLPLHREETGVYLQWNSYSLLTDILNYRIIINMQALEGGKKRYTLCNVDFRLQ